MKNSFDSKCYDLAIHFLCNDHEEPRDKPCLDELAQMIQNTVEGFLSTHQCVSNPPSIES